VSARHPAALALAALAACLAACSGARATDDLDASAVTLPDAEVSERPRLVINEIAPGGDPDDWVELHNPGAEPVLLDGYTLTDDPATPALAPLTGALAAGGYLELTISDETTGFKLGSDEELWLFDPDGTLTDGHDWIEDAAPELGSLARVPDTTGPFVGVGTPTPGAANP
jgi:hypothetical protein